MAKRFAFGAFLLDTARGTLTHDGAAVAVGQRGLRILQALLEAGGQPVSKTDLMASAWPGLVVEDSNLSVQVTALRKLLATAGVDGEAGIVTVPRLGYRMHGAVAVEQTQLAPLELGAVDHGGRPSIAVLPFAHLGDDPAQDYLADGVTEALIATLTRFRWFTVSGRGSSQVYKLRPTDNRTAAAELGVRYLVEGSVRKSGPRLRISVQLVDAPAAQCLWAEQYDFADADLFEVQDAIVHQVAGAIEPALLRNAGTAAARRQGICVTAWDLVAQGSWLFHHVTKPTHLKARERFRQAARVDAELAEARLWLGRVDAGLVAYGWSDEAARDLQEGRAAALEAVQLDERDPYAHYALAIVSNYADDFALARRSAEKAIELNPSFALGHLVHGMALLFGGDAARAAASLELGLTLNRYDPQNFVWHNLAALAFLFTDQPERALQQAVAALKVRPAWRAAVRSAAAASAALGRTDEIAGWQRQWSQAPPSADALAPLWRRHAAWAARMAHLTWPA
jgi:TolB-like protein/Flp pilus assembly protein TadD